MFLLVGTGIAGVNSIVAFQGLEVRREADPVGTERSGDSPAVDVREDLLSLSTYAELGLVGNLPFSVRDACASVIYVTTLGTDPQCLESVCTWWTADRIWIPDLNQAGP